MINRKTLSALAIATLLTGCSATDFVSPSVITAYEGIETESIRDTFGAPTSSETLENGKSLDTYVFSNRIIRRGSNEDVNSRILHARASRGQSSASQDFTFSYRNDASNYSLLGVRNDNMPRITSHDCKLEILYGSDGLVQSAKTLPKGCVVHEIATGNVQS